MVLELRGGAAAAAADRTSTAATATTIPMSLRTVSLLVAMDAVPSRTPPPPDYSMSCVSWNKAPSLGVLGVVTLNAIRASPRKEHSMHVDLTHKTCRRIGALAVVAALAVVPSSALAAPSKAKPKPKPTTLCCKGSSPYITITMSDVQIG
jgi:hypothetical protein